MKKMSSNSSPDPKNSNFVYESGHFCPDQQNMMCPPSCPLNLPPHRMWTPIDYNYVNHYYRPCFANSAHNMRTSHAMNCCLSSPQNYQQFSHNCCENHFNSYRSNSSADSQPIIIRESGDSLNGNEDQSEVTEKSDSTIDCAEEVVDVCDAKLNMKSNLDQLKAINENLRRSLGQTTDKLRETQISLIKLSEKLALDYIEKYRNDLKKYGDYIKDECKRFNRNESMTAKLVPIVQQITQALNRVKEEEVKIRQKMSAQKAMLSEEINAKYDPFVFDYKSLPEFPDLFPIYKNIIDEIPVEFLDDFTFMKNSVKEFIKWKSSIDSNEINGNNDLNVNSVKTEEYVLNIPVITDKPEIKSNESEIKESNISEEKFPAIPLSNDSSIKTSVPEVILLPFTSSDSTIDNSLRMNTNVNQTNEKLNFDIKTDNNSLKFVIKTETNNESFDSKQNQTLFGSKLSNSSSVQSQKPKENLKSREISSTNIEIRPKEELIPEENVKSNEELKNKQLLKAGEVPKVSESQRKLLDKLKDKYKNLSDQVLIESMAKTKESMISSGNPKGFSGMKFTDIIMKISDYIDREMTSIPMIPIDVIPKGWIKIEEHLWSKTSSQCSICFENISNIDTEKTRCRHSFHRSCINTWKKTEYLCPICSHKLI